jgi:coenzyme PQQ synthesis protein D (PqqD)
MIFSAAREGEVMRVSAWVKHDRLDDEVMVIDLRSGGYFAFVGAAADAWTLLAGGDDAELAGARLAERYGVRPEVGRDDVRSFCRELIAEGLLEDAPASGPREAELDALSAPLAYAAPAIERFDDLADLLLLDPVHEVETPGWPVRREDLPTDLASAAQEPD